MTPRRASFLSRSGLFMTVLSFGTLSACGGFSDYAGRATPEALEPLRAERQMIVASHSAASEAGLEILRSGGTAIDAAIASALVMGVVEPGSSGIGGGGFLMHYDADTGAIDYYDGRESAPASATPYMFLDGTGKPMPYKEAARSGKAIGVPGALRLMALAHKAHGKHPWADLFQPAISAARDGFEMYPRLHGLLVKHADLAEDAGAKALYFTDEGGPKPVGTLIQNPGLADLLKSVASKGPDAFYTGESAETILAAANAEPGPARMTATDLRGYAAIKREPVCGFYRVWLICGAAPPSSGGLAVAQMLGILQPFDLSTVAPTSNDAAHLLAEAGRLAFADRNAYVADPDFVSVPQSGLLDPGYLEMRAKSIRMDRTVGIAAPGAPAGIKDAATARSGTESDDSPDTAHLSVIDEAGNAVALTVSLATTFGSGRTASGFFLNSQLTDFAFTPNKDGKPVANRAEPGKRPRSSMSPTLVFDGSGKVVLTVGSPGGSRIIGYVAQAVVGVLDWKLDIQRAANLGHVVNRNGRTELERATSREYNRSSLEGRGHTVRITNLESGINGIQVKDGALLGGADLRRVGMAMGD